MRVRVLFFGGLKDLAGKSSDLLELPEGALVRDVLAHYLAEVPRMKELVASLAVAVNQEYAGSETGLKSGDEVALLPPVSGGSERERARRPLDSRRDAGATVWVPVLVTLQLFEIRLIRRACCSASSGVRMGLLSSLKVWCATRLAGGGRFILTMRLMKRWRCGRWKVWRSRR